MNKTNQSYYIHINIDPSYRAGRVEYIAIIYLYLRSTNQTSVLFNLILNERKAKVVH
jgi:hypothetical protein